MKLLVGLGNPGRAYVGTRHNVGFEAVDVLAHRLGWTASADGFDRQARGQFEATTLDGVLNKLDGGTEKLLLMKPQTYMNESGRSVAAAVGFYKLTAADVLVIVDELALPAGKLRLRGEGSDGGHNGLKSVARHLGTTRYARLRVGIDPAHVGEPGADYVLSRFNADQRPAIDKALPRAAGCCVAWADQGLSYAMNQFNTPDDKPARKTEPGPAGSGVKSA